MKTNKRLKKGRLRKGIYILPNLSTTMNLFCGFYAVICSVNQEFTSAATAILIAIVFDALDGKIARATHTTSKFGVEFDSLADVISFGLAPGLLAYLWALQPMGRIGWLAGFLFMACGALRLARFNTQVGSISSEFFIGLPIPAAAGMVATTVLFCSRVNIVIADYPVVILVMLYTLAFLMVSTVKYNSFKKPELFKRMNFNMLVASVLIFIFIAAQPAVALFLIMFSYLLLGPVTTINFYRKSRKEIADNPVEEHKSVS